MNKLLSSDVPRPVDCMEEIEGEGRSTGIVLCSMYVCAARSMWCVCKHLVLFSM